VESPFRRYQPHTAYELEGSDRNDLSCKTIRRFQNRRRFQGSSIIILHASYQFRYQLNLASTVLIHSFFRDRSCNYQFDLTYPLHTSSGIIYHELLITCFVMFCVSNDIGPNLATVYRLVLSHQLFYGDQIPTLPVKSIYRADF